MSFVYALLPAMSLVFSMGNRCNPEPHVWMPPDALRKAVWVALAVTTGIAGVNIYNINDEEASTIYIALVFFFGTGWVLSTRICHQWINVLYVGLLLATCIWLLKRLATLKDTFPSEAKTARAWTFPLFFWLCFASLLALNALRAKLFQKGRAFSLL